MLTIIQIHSIHRPRNASLTISSFSDPSTQYRTSLLTFCMTSSLVPLRPLIHCSNSASRFSVLIFLRATQSRHKSSRNFSVPKCLYSGSFLNFLLNSNQYSLESPFCSSSRKYATLGYQLAFIIDKGRRDIHLPFLPGLFPL